MSYTPITAGSAATTGLFDRRFEQVYTDMQTRIVSTATEWDLETDTADGSDNKAISLTGGGNDVITRGAVLKITGNECTDSPPTPPGGIGLFTGDVSTGAIVMFVGSSASTLVRATHNGRFEMHRARSSLRTLAASAVTVSAANSNITADEIVFTIGGASGASLCIHSGGTVYIFNSAISAAAT